MILLKNLNCPLRRYFYWAKCISTTIRIPISSIWPNRSKMNSKV
jgi:hypothetical protein